MSEVTKASIAAEFCRMARAATGNSPESHDAQLFFKTRLMGVTNPDLLEPHPKFADDAERAKFQSKCMEGLENVIRSLTGTEFQTAVGFDTMIKTVPKHETGITLVLYKVGLSAGIAKPRGWAPKRELNSL